MQNKNIEIEAAIERAIARKREYDEINRLVSDTSLKRTIRKAHPTPAGDSPLTLLGCLACDIPDPFPPRPTLHALNENIRELGMIGAIRQPGNLANKLLNPTQFLNTLSELALARTLIKEEWSVRLEQIFFDLKDADISAERPGEVNLIEVTNLNNPEPILEPKIVYSAMVSEIGDKDLAVQKIITKYQNKFEVAYERGWCGRSWVALDVSKNHVQDISISIQSLIRDTWIDELAEHVRHECKNLTGVIVYSTRPTEMLALVLCWHPL